MTCSQKAHVANRFQIPVVSSAIHELSVRCYLSGQRVTGAVLSRVQAGRRDSGDVLTNVVFTVGLVIIAGLVLAVLKNKATTVTNNICTNADPSTC